MRPRVCTHPPRVEMQTPAPPNRATRPGSSGEIIERYTPMQHTCSRPLARDSTQQGHLHYIFKPLSVERLLSLYRHPANRSSHSLSSLSCMLALHPIRSRTQLDSPAICLPGLSRPSVAVRCSPRLYKARQGGGAALQPPASPTGVSGLNDIESHR